MDFTNFISENMAILVPVLWILGIFLKKSKVQDYFIPWILVLIALGLAIWMNGVNPDSVIQGILVAGGAVLTQNLIKQTKRIKEEK